jgi:hypothetical protein
LAKTTFCWLPPDSRATTSYGPPRSRNRSVKSAVRRTSSDREGSMPPRPSAGRLTVVAHTVRSAINPYRTQEASDLVSTLLVSGGSAYL